MQHTSSLENSMDTAIYTHILTKYGEMLSTLWQKWKKKLFDSFTHDTHISNIHC